MPRSRREFLRLSGTAVGVICLGGLLQACGGSGAVSSSAASTVKAAPASSQVPAASSAKAAPTSSQAPAASAQAASTQAEAKAPTKLEPVKLAWAVTSLANMPLMLALDKGYFREQGIDLQPEEVQSSSDLMVFVASDQIQVTGGPPSVPFFNAVERGLEVKLVAPMKTQAPGNTPVVVRKDLFDSGAVKNIKDLKGRKVVVNTRGGGLDYALVKIMRDVGMSANDVEWVTMPFPDMQVAFTNKAVDAGVLPEPFASHAYQAGLIVKLVLDPVPHQMGTAIFFGPTLLRTKRDLGVRFLVGYLKGMRDLQGRANILSDANVAIFAKYTRMKPELIKSIPPDIFDPNLAIDVGSLLDQQAIHMWDGMLKYTTPLPQDKLVDDSLAKEAVAKLGAYKKP